jgi:DNA repair protein RadC
LTKVPRQSDAKRYARYSVVIEALRSHEEFTPEEIAERIPGEARNFITRIIHELERQRYLQRTNADRFRWADSDSALGAATWLDAKIYGPRLTRTPVADRPRERLLALGAPALRTPELLAILIRSGRPGESALQAGEKIAARFADKLALLVNQSASELKAISSAVIEPAYCQIMAGIELGRRIERAQQQQENPTRIQGSSEAVAFCRRVFERMARDGTQEEFHLVCLDTKHQVIGTHLISVGLLSESLVAPREVFRPAIRDAAAAVILVHNHPSGDPTPSPEDLAVTRRMEEAALTIGIKLLDHIIVGRHGCVSIRENDHR